MLHRHFTVNGRRVNIPSYLLRPAMLLPLTSSLKAAIKLKPSPRLTARVPARLARCGPRKPPAVIALPNRDDFDVEEHLIVELYSKN